MKSWSRAKIGGLVLVAGLVGYLIGPPIANAALSVVRIGTGNRSSELRIVKGSALVDPGLVFQTNNGNGVIKSGTASGDACTAAFVLDAVVVDSPIGATTISVTANGTPVWSGAVGSGGHLNDTFDGGVYSGRSPLSVTETGTGTWYLYGICSSGNGVIARVLGMPRA